MTRIVRTAYRYKRPPGRKTRPRSRSSPWSPFTEQIQCDLRDDAIFAAATALIVA
jgi:hypothetical protein